MNVIDAAKTLIRGRDGSDRGHGGAVGRLVDAAWAGMWLCRVGFVLCAIAIALEATALIASFPADIGRVLSWESVGYGTNDAAGMTRIEGYLVEDKQAGVQPETAYLMFEADGSVPLAGGLARTASLAFGMAVLAVGARFFHRIGLSGRPFERPRARELSIIGALALAAAIVPNAIGLAISTWAYNTYLIQYQFVWGAWGPGAVDGWLVALGAFVLMMARVFDYGCILQDQDDRLL